jgi:RNA polymerase sigma-70 factor (ECF subfamily)
VDLSPPLVATDSGRTPAPQTPEAFARWVEPHLGAMIRLATRLSTVTDGQDVLQEALVRAWSKRHTFDDRRGTPSAWLPAITADQARRSRRRNARALVETAHPPVAAIDERLDVELAVARLPTRQRMAVDCYYFAGLTVDQTAAVMHCSPGTVKSALSDARSRLRTMLGADDV